jgi:signal transduction histidine kinase
MQQATSFSIECTTSNDRHHASHDPTLRREALAIICNELRTPLNTILGFGDLLDANPDPALDVPHYAKGIRMAGEALREIVEDLITLGKLSVPQPELVLEPIALPTFWQRCADHCAALAHESVVIDWRPIATDVVIVTDVAKLTRVLWHLVGNACKFAACGTVRVTADVDEHQFRFEVRDDGIGIGPQDGERVFEPFWQADSSTARLHGGMGLGLYLARRIVLQLGGTIGFDSQPNRGATFHLTLPRRAPMSLGETP